MTCPSFCSTFWGVQALGKPSGSTQFANTLQKTSAQKSSSAFLIAGETLHSLLYLPLCNSKLEPLVGKRLLDLQRKFQNVGVLIIDEKSMVGQEMVSERLKQARPQMHAEPFGNISIVLLGDWQQLPPVGDASLFSKETKKPRGFNLYQLFHDVIIFYGAASCSSPLSSISQLTIIVLPSFEKNSEIYNQTAQFDPQYEAVL
jgi:hypothetical protein